MTLRQAIQQARAHVERRIGEADRLHRDRDAVEAKLAVNRQTLTDFEEVVLLLQRTATTARETACQQIELLVTQFLRAVFGPDYSFRIDMTERAGRAEADFYVLSEYEGQLLKTRPQDARGGGVVDVISLGLRIAMLQTYRPALAGPLLADEPAKHVSEDLIQAVAHLLKMVSDEFKRQIIMVTHSEELMEAADRVFKVQIHSGRSHVTMEE